MNFKVVFPSLVTVLQTILVRHHQQPVHSPGLLKSVLILLGSDTFAARLYLGDFLVLARSDNYDTFAARLYLGDFLVLARSWADTSQIVSVLNMLSAGDVVL